MTSTYTITDEINGTIVTGIESYDIAETLRGLNPEAPAEVYEACDRVQDKANRHEYYGDEETYLPVTVTR